MSLFWLLAAVLAGLAVAFVAPPLLGRAPRASAPRERVNAAIYRDRLRELDEEFSGSERHTPAYDMARAELLKDLAVDTGQPASPARTRDTMTPRISVVVIAGGLPVGTLIAYLFLGEPALFLPVTARAPSPIAAAPVDSVDPAMPPVQQMVSRLEQRLERDPADVEGWLLLARSYGELDELERARGALERALAANPGDLDLQVAQAETIGRIQGNRLTGEPLEILHRVLERSPVHRKGLWLTGIGELQAGNPARSLELWDRLQASGPLEAEEGELLARFVAHARAELASAIDPRIAGAPPTAGSASSAVPAAPGVASGAGASTPGDAPEASAEGNRTGADWTPAVGPPARLTVRISLAPELTARAAGTDTVFVFARAAQGARMPLAITRRTAAELPLTVELDDSMAMLPALRLSSVDEVIVGARVSRTGNATPSPGDLFGESGPVAPTSGDAVHVRIERLVP